MIVAEIYSAPRDDLASQDLMAQLNIEPGATSTRWERLGRPSARDP